MDRSITTGCFSASNAIAKTSLALPAFVREVRESRSEMDTISSELHSLEGVLDLMKDDAASMPPELARLAPEVLGNCTTIVNELDGYLSTLNSNGLSRTDKKFRWIATRDHMEKLRMTLEGYKSTLGLALDLVALTSQPRTPDTKEETARMGSEIASLTARLHGEFSKNGALLNLQSFLDALRAHAEGSGVSIEADQASSVSDGPDSAIEMSDEPPFTPAKAPEHHGQVGLPMDEIDELLDQLEDMPTRPPTPPPKAARRNSVRSSIILSPPQFDRRPSTTESAATTSAASPGFLDSSLHPAVPTRGSSIRPFDLPPSHRRAESLYTAVTILSSDDSQSLRSAATKPTINNSNNNRMSRFFGHMRNALSESTSASSSAGTPARPRTASDVSRRFSTTLRRFPLSIPIPFPHRDGATTASQAAEPDAVFGVSLSKSMQIAKSTAKTHHTGSGSSRRDFPLCMLSSVTYLRESHGYLAPDIFGTASDSPARVAALRALFSAAPDYGANLDWSAFMPHDAADLMLYFLSSLPKPLVPEAVARRWVVLSKQATLPGSHAVRLEQCIDFWEEALGGIRGPARSLFKLLLNLWGDVADAADANDMTAERLAGRLVKPLMHTPAGRYDTDFMLGLAFLIRKRSEYTMLLRGSGRKSNAAFES